MTDTYSKCIATALFCQPCWISCMYHTCSFTSLSTLWWLSLIYASPLPARGANAYMFYRCFFCFFFRSPQNMRQPFSGTAERIFMKLLPNDRRGKWSFQRLTQMGFTVFSPQKNFQGTMPPKNFLGAKNWKIAIAAYSSELITPERKRISERLKRLWNHKTMAYKVYVRPWPLTPDINTVRAFACTSAKIPGFWRFPQNFLLQPPRQTYTVNSPRGALQVWKILWTLTHKRRWAIRLKHWEFRRSPVCQQRFSGTVSPPGERGCVKNHERANAFNLVCQVAPLFNNQSAKSGEVGKD